MSCPQQGVDDLYALGTIFGFKVPIRFPKVSERMRQVQCGIAGERP